MATITSVGSGAWSVAGTWNAGVPVDGDDVVIASGTTVTFDADQSAFTTGISLAIRGTLNHALTGGPYTMFLKTGVSLSGEGTWNVGTKANPIPFAVKHTITGTGEWRSGFATGSQLNVHAAEPTIKYVKLTADKAIGQTVLEVDTDVTGDIWADGDRVCVADINQTNEAEFYFIDTGGISANTITLTGTGLTAAKSAGAVICLMTRNVKFVTHSTGSNIMLNPYQFNLAGGEFGNDTDTSVYCILTSSGGSTISGGTFMRSTLGIQNTTTITGGTFCRLQNTLYGSTNSEITGGVFAGNTQMFYSSTGGKVSGGEFFGNYYIITVGTGFLVTGGTFTGGYSVIDSVAGASIVGGTFVNNNRITNRTSVYVSNLESNSTNYDFATTELTAINTKFDAPVEVSGYNSLAIFNYSESIDHDQVAGAYKAWTKGGVTIKQAVTYPTGFTNSMETVLESATSEGYWRKEISVGAGKSVNITSYLRKDASMTYLPRVIMFLNNTTDPFAGGTGLHTFTMTDSVDTWEDDTYTYSNDTSDDVVLVIRTQGKNATGKLFSYLDIEVINVDLTSVLALLNTIDGKADTIDTNVDSILADTGTDGVLVSSGTGAKQISLDSGKVLLQATQTGVTIPTVTTLTNLPAVPTDWLTAAGVKADAVAKLQANLALEATLTAMKGAGWTTQSLKALADAILNLDGDVADVFDDVGGVKAELDLVYADTNELQGDWKDGGRLDLILDAASAHTAASVADAVWDEALAGHAVAGSAGKTLFDIDPDTLADSVYDELVTIPAISLGVPADGEMDIYVTDSLHVSISDLGSLANVSKLYVSFKERYEDTDADSILQLEESQGLLVVNGATATPTDGSITIDDAVAGDITLDVAASVMDDIAVKACVYDVKVIRTAGVAVQTLHQGKAHFHRSVTKAVS